MRRFLQSEEERVRQLRLCLLVHSYIYYHLNTSIVNDHQWQAWADELVERQKEFKRRIDCYDDAFRDWDASTGYHLPVDSWVRSKAEYLLRLAGQRPQATPDPIIKTRPTSQSRPPSRRSIFDL